MRVIIVIFILESFGVGHRKSGGILCLAWLTVTCALSLTALSRSLQNAIFGTVGVIVLRERKAWLELKDASCSATFHELVNEFRVTAPRFYGLCSLNMIFFLRRS